MHVNTRHMKRVRELIHTLSSVVWCHLHGGDRKRRHWRWRRRIWTCAQPAGSGDEARPLRMRVRARRLAVKVKDGVFVDMTTVTAVARARWHCEVSRQRWRSAGIQRLRDAGEVKSVRTTSQSINTNGITRWRLLLYKNVARWI